MINSELNFLLSFYIVEENKKGIDLFHDLQVKI